MLKYNAKYIEKIFYQYDKIKQAVNEARKDPASCKTGGNGSGHAFVSDPTANVAIKEVTPIKAVVINITKQEQMKIMEPEKWLQVVDYTYEYFCNKKTGKVTYDVITRKYRKGEDYREISMSIGIGQTTCFMYVREANQYASLCAVGLGLMTPFNI